MASFFTAGESKIRPGVYYRYENYQSSATVGADDGKCACVLRSNWGPLDQAVVLTSSSDISTYFGSGDNDSTLAVPLEQFNGGAKEVRAVRLGTGGTKGTVTLKDEEGNTILQVTSKYVGSRDLTITLRPTLEATYNSIDCTVYEELEEEVYEDLEEMTYEELEAYDFTDDATYEFLVMEGTTELEKITFKNPTGEKTSWLLEEAMLRSNYVDLTRLNVTESRIATISQVEIEGGSDPYIDVNSYSNAFEVLEVYRWNTLALDTDDATIAQISQLYVNRIYEDGKFAMVVVGIPVSTDFDARLDRAEEYNDYQVVVVGSGFLDSNGTQYDGYLAAARVSGMIAGTPSNQSITHSAITSATDIMEHLTTSQYESAIQAGLLTFSVSASNVVWVEQGINSLTDLEANMDNGWKKIKRTKVRFELMQRLNDVVEPLVGKVNNDADGRMTVVQVSNGVCQSMVAEGKILSGAKVEVDSSVTPEGDSASFIVYADDIDSMEKLYFGFMFRFSPES